MGTSPSSTRTNGTRAKAGVFSTATGKGVRQGHQHRQRRINSTRLHCCGASANPRSSKGSRGSIAFTRRGRRGLVHVICEQDVTNGGSRLPTPARATSILNGTGYLRRRRPPIARRHLCRWFRLMNIAVDPGVRRPSWSRDATAAFPRKNDSPASAQMIYIDPNGLGARNYANWAVLRRHGCRPLKLSGRPTSAPPSIRVGSWLLDFGVSGFSKGELPAEDWPPTASNGVVK